MDVSSEIRSFSRRFLLVTLIVIGAICGVLAVVFERYVELARHALIGAALNRPEPYRTLLIIATPTIVFTILALLVRRFAPRAVGANLARVRMAYNSDPKLLGPRSIGATFLATPISLGAGAPLGPEGPIVVLASGVSAALARALKLPKQLVRGMIPVGVAAGISAVFNTPMTGVVFALEEVFGTADRGLLGGVLVGAVAAAVVERVLLGGKPLLAAPYSTWNSARDLLGFAVVGVIAGIVSGFAIAAAHRLKRAWAKAMPSLVLRAALSGVLVGTAGLIAPSILGVGYDSVSLWLHGGGTARGTAIAFAVKTIAFVIAISGGILGGTFAPSLFIGAALGASVGHSMHYVFPHSATDPRAFAILGMGSFFAGLLRSPIAAVFIVVELTRDYDLIVPLMLGVSLAVAISRRISPFSVVEQQMIDEGWIEGHEAHDPLAQAKAADTMTPNPISMNAGATLLDAIRGVAGTHHRFYPVVDDDRRLVGVVTRESIDRVVREGGAERALREIMEAPKLVATADESVIEIIRRMRLNGADRCPVVDDDIAQRLVGFLSPGDVLRARMKHVSGSEEERFELFE